MELSSCLILTQKKKSCCVNELGLASPPTRPTGSFSTILFEALNLNLTQKMKIVNISPLFANK